MTVAMTGVHRGRFGAAMDEFRRRRGAEPDRAWRTLVLLATAVPGFWERVREHIDWEQMQLDPAAVPVASFDEARLLRVAANMLQGQGAIVVHGAGDGAGVAASGSKQPTGPGQAAESGQTPGPEQPPDPEQVPGPQQAPDPQPIIGVDVRDLADNMDGALWRVVMLAWEEYQKRGG